MTVNSSALQAVEWCNPSTSCYGFCCSIAIIASGDGRQMVKCCENYWRAVVEKWHATVAKDGDIGIQVSQFCRDCVFRECRRVTITECQFEDDSSLFAKTYGDAERALASFREAAASFGLSVNLGKTKFMPMGVGVVASDMVPLGGTVECVDSFRYLGCQITPDARSSFDVSRRIAAASGAFGTLKKAVFANPEFPIGLKRVVYGVTVLAVLLYGAENWTPRQRDLQRLESFHLRSIRMVLSISRARQMDEHVTTLQVRQWWGDMEQVSDKVRRRRLQWLGHLARMDDRIPRQLLFGALPSKRPPHGWKDPVKHDLAAVSIGMNEWLDTADNRSEWRTRCQDGVYNVVCSRVQPAVKPLLCMVCTRHFSRPQDIARHSCTSRRSAKAKNKH